MEEKFIQIMALTPGFFSGVKNGLIALTNKGRVFYTTDFTNWKEAQDLPLKPTE